MFYWACILLYRKNYTRFLYKQRIFSHNIFSHIFSHSVSVTYLFIELSLKCVYYI